MAIRYTISQLLDYLENHGIYARARRASIRSQIYRWCSEKEVERSDRKRPSTLQAKLHKGEHWIESDGERLFTVKGRNEIVRRKSATRALKRMNQFT